MAEDERHKYFNTTQSKQEVFTTQDESLEKLLDEVMELTTPTPHVVENDPKQSVKEKRTKKKTGISWRSLWLSIVVLTSFFTGSLFGLFWAREKPNLKAHAATLEEVKAQLTHLIQEVQTLQNSTATPSEIIEPFKEAPNHPENLTPKALM